VSVLFGGRSILQKTFFITTETTWTRARQTAASSLKERRKEVPEWQTTYDGIVSKNGAIHHHQDLYFIQDLPSASMYLDEQSEVICKAIIAEPSSLC